MRQNGQKNNKGASTTQSAYEAQFQEVLAPFKTDHLWTARAEPKVILFAWTVMHEKAADNLEAKGWDNNVICPLCLQQAETNRHLLIQCPYAQQVRELVTQWKQKRTDTTDAIDSCRMMETICRKHAYTTQERGSGKNPICMVEYMEREESKNFSRA